jgi:cation diffusion facilitator family transporter
MQKVKERVALTSILVSAGLMVGKAIVGVLTGSLAILSDAAHSLSDVFATTITYLAVRFSGKPADEEHHYGHGKIESIAALAATALLFLLSGLVMLEAGRRLLFGAETAVSITLWTFGVIAIVIGVDFFRARLLYRIAGETSSEALEADALHFTADMWSSVAVLAGLFGTWLGFVWADAVAAMVVAVFICVAGWKLGSRTVQTLMDQAPEGVAEQVFRIVSRVPGVVEIERTRARRAGPTLFVELSVAVSRTMPFDRVAELKEQVAQAVKRALPQAEVAVVTSPRALDDETVADRVLVIARNRGLAVHHVTVHSVSDTLAVALDLEVDGALTLAAAHDIASGLEQAIADELGPQVEVETHIEPLQVADLAGADAAPERVAEVRRLLASIAQGSGPVADIHDVRVRETAQGDVVNFHCRVDPALAVDAVHEAVDQVERALRRAMPSARRVIGHAEPRLPR